MELILSILQLILVFGVGLLIAYVKKIPEQVHAKNLKVFESDLNKQLEIFKSELTTELELMKINESQLHIHKTEEFNRLVNVLIMQMLNKDFTSKLGHDPTISKEFTQTMADLGTKLFFFASDNTVKKFVEWRKYSLTVGENGYDSIWVIVLLAELIVEIRKDLGYSGTACDKDDFLNIILTDWHKHQHLYQETRV